MHIIVASTNPVKIEASLRGFKRMFPETEWSADGVSVPSGVSGQPMTDDETYQGAFNRAVNARAAFPDADFWIGLEGGAHDTKTEMFSMGWVVVLSKDRMGKARTPTYVLPPKIAELLRGGMELGAADDMVFKKNDSNKKEGAVGILTGGAYDRTFAFETGVVFALIPFKQTELYPAE